jgi:hypothetical protein
MLAFVEFSSCITNNEEKSTQFIRGGGVFASRGRNMGRNAFVQGELAFMLWELFVA